MAKRSGPAERMGALSDILQQTVPSFFSWVEDLEEIREVRFKLKGDGTLLVVAKGYFDDGGAAVAFGVGYGFVGALMGIDATIHGNHWKVDRPWRRSEGKEDKAG